MASYDEQKAQNLAQMVSEYEAKSEQEKWRVAEQNAYVSRGLDAVIHQKKCAEIAVQKYAFYTRLKDYTYRVYENKENQLISKYALKYAFGKYKVKVGVLPSLHDIMMPGDIMMLAHIMDSRICSR